MYVKVSIAVAITAFVVYGTKLYFSGCICDSNQKLDGRTVIITGGNSGIGKETAVDLAKRGAKVIIGCRDLNRGNIALNEIRQRSGNIDVYVKEIDLASFASISKFAKEIVENEERLDILINNAGVGMCPQQKTKDGFELQFGVNHLGHFLLTNLLLDLIKKSAPSRIVTVSSFAHKMVKEINFDDINFENGYYSFLAYGQSKLANILFTYEMNKKLQGTGVSTFSLHPGVIATNFSRHFPLVNNKLFQPIFNSIMHFLFQDSQRGAQTTICCAVEQGIEKYSGQYFSACKPSQLLLNQEESRKLWEISEKMVGTEYLTID